MKTCKDYYLWSKGCEKMCDDASALGKGTPGFILFHIVFRVIFKIVELFI